jgi:hypothetical protein
MYLHVHNARIFVNMASKYAWHISKFKLYIACIDF